MDFPRLPKFDAGQRVRVLVDLFNDGSFPDAPQNALLAPAGAVGEIVKVGMMVEPETPIYLVEFEESRVIGCLEGEIATMDERSLAGVMRD
jgi:nitrogen fixation protein NifZ